MEGIIIAIITGLLSLIGIIISNVSSNRKIEHSLQTAQEVTNTKLTYMADDLKKVSSFTERIPMMEVKLAGLEHRINKLEDK